MDSLDGCHIKVVEKVILGYKVAWLDNKIDRCGNKVVRIDNKVVRLDNKLLDTAIKLLDTAIKLHSAITSYFDIAQLIDIDFRLMHVQ